MTTVAWDGKTLATDSWLVGGAKLDRDCRKIFLSKDWAYGGAGQWSDVMAISRWIAEGRSLERFPKLDNAPGPFGIIVERAVKRAYTLEGGSLALIPIKGIGAVGSGGEYAIAAMALGKTSAEAVRFAARFDYRSGGRVQTFHHPLVKRR